MKPLEYKTQHHPTTSSTLSRTPHLNKKKNISRQDYHLTQPCLSEEKQTNRQKLSTNLTQYETYTSHLRRAETKREKEFNLFQGKNSTFLETWEMLMVSLFSCVRLCVTP